MREDLHHSFGCEYCRDDQNRFHGQVQIESRESRQMIPGPALSARHAAKGEEATRRLTEAEARDLYTEFS